MSSRDVVADLILASPDTGTIMVVTSDLRDEDGTCVFEVGNRDEDWRVEVSMSLLESKER